MREHGYTEGRNILIEWRAAEGLVERVEALANELVKLRVDVIVTALTPAAQAAKKATSTIPIVMAYVGEPLGVGLVKSLARPGGNMTGLSASSAELEGKRIALLHELIPGLRRLALLINRSDPFSGPFIEQSKAPAKRLGMELHVSDIGASQDFEAAFAEMKKLGVGAVIVQGVLMSRAKQIAESALRHHLVAASPQKQFVRVGGLMSYGADFNDLTRRSAAYVDKILKGAKPADLPVEQPTKFQLVVNLKTAQALGLTIPPTILAGADEVIE